MAFDIYTDTNLTQVFVPPINFEHNSDGSTGDLDAVLYIGDPNSGGQLQAASNPGVDQIVATLGDSNVNPGNTPETVDVKLATSNGGLTAAVAGDPLNLGVTIAGGVGNKVELHMRVVLPTAPVAVYNELSINTNTVRET
ncbi:MAG: hypothetical protein COB22_07900 [Cycloclasticus sp.]|nr:MAG: hypothetical protein COB22_07900 [Cycloclasticus sp.]